MKLVNCKYDNHAQPILDIVNEAIVNSTSVYDYKPRAPESMRSWFDAKSAGHFPVIGIEDASGTLLGFASYGTFRAWPAYKYSVEHSLYVHRDYRGQGLGRRLLEALIAHANQADVHVMIGGIDMSNAASIALHEKLGFVHAGTINEAAFKFGRWLNLGFYQLTLSSPAHPVDDM